MPLWFRLALELLTFAPMRAYRALQSDAEGRREAKRYEIELPLRFTAMRRGASPLTGAGQSVNLSRTGLLFHCEGRLMIGDSLLVVLDWPIVAEADENLKLVVTGYVVRIRRRLVGMAVHSHRLLREREFDNRLTAFWAPAERASISNRTTV